MPGSEREPDVARVASGAVQRVATFLRSLTVDEVEDLATGRAKLVLVRPERRKRIVEDDLSIGRIQEIVASLLAMTKRERGEEYLREVASTRAALTRIAGAMDLPAMKTDNVERLRDRIIEATIGYRLRSDAIRGTDPGSWRQAPFGEARGDPGHGPKGGLRPSEGRQGPGN